MIATLLASLALVAPAEPQWRGPLLPQPLPGADFSGGLGRTGPPSFYSPTRGVVSIEGSTSVPKGLYGFDGERWKLISTVCGANPERTDIAWAGPDELWVIADPAPDPSSPPADFGPYQPRDEGTTLCHIKGGRVIGSYGVPVSDVPRWHPLTSAACKAPDDCWFAGNAVLGAPGGEGTFMLHWDGTQPRIVWGRSGRGVSDMAVHDGELWQSTVFGQRPERREPPVLREGEAADRLLRRVEPAGTLLVDPFAARTRGGCATAGCGSLEEDELLALDAHEDALWAVGGGASSGSLLGGNWGQRVPPNQSDSNGEANPRLPLAAIRVGGRWHQLRFDPTQEAARLNANMRFADVAAIPGRAYEAWVAVETYEGQNGGLEREGERSRYQLASPRMARIRFRPQDADQPVNADILEVVAPPAGEALGGARHIACPGEDDCWAITREGWFFRWSADPNPTTRDDAFPFKGVMAERPPDGRTRAPVPDTPPPDDSLAFAPQPVVIDAPAPAPTPIAAPPAKTRKLAALVTGVKTKVVGERRLRVTFRLARPARLALETRRGKRALHRTAARRLQPGDHELTVRFSTVPNGIHFYTEELAPTAPTLAASARRSGSDAVRVRAKVPSAGTLSIRAKTTRKILHPRKDGTVTTTLRAGAGRIDLRFDGPSGKPLHWTLRVGR